ncbi:MAG: hypothetical protein Q8O52_28935 [Sulfuritalea sp.]|nr:hypothetical protein [Sulfuritalea sp.]
MKERFTTETRERLTACFARECLKAHPTADKAQISDEANQFIGCLERFAASIPQLRKLSSFEINQRRQERLEALANALDRVIDVAAEMDDATLGFAMYRGLGNATAGADDREGNLLQELHVDWSGDKGLWRAHDLKNLKPQMAAFALGVRRAVPDLVVPDSAREKPEEMLATLIEEQLGRMGMSCAATDTGLAGTAFLETMALTDGSQALTKTAKNWLAKAAKSKRSWRQFIATINARDSS